MGFGSSLTKAVKKASGLGGKSAKDLVKSSLNPVIPGKSWNNIGDLLDPAGLFGMMHGGGGSNYGGSRYVSNYQPVPYTYGPEVNRQYQNMASFYGVDPSIYAPPPQQPMNQLLQVPPAMTQQQAQPQQQMPQNMLLHRGRFATPIGRGFGGFGGGAWNRMF